MYTLYNLFHSVLVYPSCLGRENGAWGAVLFFVPTLGISKLFNFGIRDNYDDSRYGQVFFATARDTWVCSLGMNDPYYAERPRVCNRNCAVAGSALCGFSARGVLQYLFGCFWSSIPGRRLLLSWDSFRQCSAVHAASVCIVGGMAGKGRELSVGSTFKFCSISRCQRSCGRQCPLVCLLLRACFDALHLPRQHLLWQPARHHCV